MSILIDSCIKSKQRAQDVHTEEKGRKLKLKVCLTRREISLARLGLTLVHVLLPATALCFRETEGRKPRETLPLSNPEKPSVA